MRTTQFLNQFSPKAILSKLEESVIGQDEAKRALVSAVWWNLYRASLLDAGHDQRLLPAKLNVLLMGPSGIGKTELAKSVAGLFDVPWITTAAPNYSSSGYTGADVDDMLGLLLQAAGGDCAMAEQGIVVLDEVDKLRRRDFGGQSDVGCEAIQQALLALLEGCEAMPRSRGGERVKMRSHFVTFVGTGAFVGLDVPPGPVSATALIGDGFIPEFIARWSMRIRLQDIDRDMLRKIIHGRRSALSKLVNLFALHGIEFVTDEKAIDMLIEQSMTDGVGARGLNETLWTHLNGLIAEIPQMLEAGIRRVVVDPGTINGLPAWKIPGETDSLPASAIALAHPTRAPQAMDTLGWSDAELHQRLDYLLRRIGFDKSRSDTQTAFRAHLRTIGDGKLAANVQLCELLAFDLVPACTVEEFCSAIQETECEGVDGVLHWIRYRRVIQAEQKPTPPARAPRRKTTCPKCAASLSSRAMRCPACGAEAHHPPTV